MYSGCINQDPPGQYLVVVPDFGDNRPAPRRPAPRTAAATSSSVSFGRAGRSSSSSDKTLFWCATAADSDSYVTEWGKCAAGCRADPAGSWLPAAPRTAGFLAQPHTVGELLQVIKAGVGPRAAGRPVQFL